MPHLIVREAGQVAFSLSLRDGLTAGRGDQNDLALEDRKASRQHVRFVATGEGWEVTDLGSTHGTFVGGQRIDSRRLRDGDRIQLGNALLTYRDGDEPVEIVDHQETAPGVSADPQIATRATERLRLSSLYEVARAVGSLKDTDALLGRMLAATIEALGCDRGLVGVPEGDGAPRCIARARGGHPIDPAGIVVSRSILDAVLRRREQVIFQDAASAPATLLREGILSAMAVPLQVEGRVLGLFYVDDRAERHRFDREDLDFLNALAHLTSAALAGAESYQRASLTAEALREHTRADELLGGSEPMRRLVEEIRKYAAAGRVHVLIQGETGTGKELVAHTLHALSARADLPFIAVNCAAIPDDMIESELFGHARGAFTGAVRDRRGKFVLADRGTLFLDEIGDLSLSAQAKVLRAVEEGEIASLGAEKTQRVDVRVVAASHKDLHEEVRSGRFREDLYYRLSVVEIAVPPLRERGDDVVELAQAFLRRAASRVGKRLLGFTPAALDLLRRHTWPGNVRELQNEVERAAIVSDGAWIDAGDIRPRLAREAIARSAAGQTEPAATLAERFARLEPMEREIVEEALRRARGNVSEAARLLGITRIMMKRRMDRFGLGGGEEPA